MPPIVEIAELAAAFVFGGVIAGFLAGLFGIGGGAVLVPIFYQVFTALDVDAAVRMHLCVGTSLAVIVPTSVRSYLAHRQRGAVDMGLLRAWLLPVPAGVVTASVVAAFASSTVLRGLFSLVTAMVGIRMLVYRLDWRIGDELPGNPVRAIVGGVIGLLSGLMGIGGGVMTTTFMTLFDRPVHQAVATGSGVGVLVSLPGLIGYVWAGWGEAGLPPFSTGFVNWIAVALIIPITLAIAPVGVRVAHALDKRYLQLMLGIFLLLVSARFAYSVIG